jgi:hypothetical protein
MFTLFSKQTWAPSNGIENILKRSSFDSKNSIYSQWTAFVSLDLSSETSMDDRPILILTLIPFWYFSRQSITEGESEFHSIQRIIETTINIIYSFYWINTCHNWGIVPPLREPTFGATIPESLNNAATYFAINTRQYPFPEILSCSNRNLKILGTT